MIENYKLSNFVAPKSVKNSKNELIKLINNNRNIYPYLFLLITDTTGFCENYFNQFLKLVRREKRLLEFQTPNRIKFNHEYTIAKNSLESDFYYLFTPIGRLDWLTISIEEEKVSIADKDIVKNKIQYIVTDELKKIISNNELNTNYTKNDLMSIIYENLTGLPCFIEYNKTEKLSNQQSIIISINYFESITPILNKKVFKPILKIFSPLLEKRIVYQYAPLSNDYNSWLYLNSPKNFEIKSNILKNNKNIESAKTKDPEIASYVIKGNGSKITYLFEILIYVPKSLKVWFITIYYLSLIYLFTIILYVFDKLDLISKIDSLHFLCITHNSISIFDKSIISNVSLAIIAGIIATRGWLIIEENVLRNISIKFTYIMISLVLITLLVNYI